MALKMKKNSFCPPPPTGNGDVTDFQKKKLPYPKAVFFIVVTEFCERFSYYGMRAVLTLYMGNVLHFSDDLATTIYHVFLFLCYFLPLFGGILADSFIGKYATVFALSSIFAIGNIMLTSAATPPLHLPIVPFSLAGLLLMAIGTGGIKPCVVALGGDQFHSVFQETQLKQFFSIFFFAVSVGNMFSTVLTPVLRSNVQCFNQDSCYPLAFGVPATLMIFAVVIFVSGKRLYKINKPTENIILRVIQCIKHAISQRRKEKSMEGKDVEKKHWVDYAHYEGSKFDKQLVDDTKSLMRVLVYYLPIPMFWALYEQLGSRWTLQATNMNGSLGFYTIQPDQMQVSNAILMFIFIPVFETVLYPILRKCNIFKRPLQRMTVGGILAALSFLLAGFTEMRIEKNTLQLPSSLSSLNETHLNIINTLGCPVSIRTVEGSSLTNETLAQFESHIVAPEDNLVLRSITQRNVKLSIAVALSDFPACLFHHLPRPSPSSNTFKSLQFPPHNLTSHLPNEESPPPPLTLWSSLPPSTLPGQVQHVLVSQINGSLQIHVLQLPPLVGNRSKDTSTQLTILNVRSGEDRKGGENVLFRVRLVSKNGNVEYYPLTPNNSSTDGTREEDSSLKLTLPSDGGWYSVHLESSSQGNPGTSSWKGIRGTDLLNWENTGSYLLIFREDKDGRTKEDLVTLIPPRIHMLWLLPQYIVMAWAEVLFIISGMEFSYSEAPASMKSVLQSCWHLTNAAGNLMVIIAAQIKGHHSQATEFLIFSSLMGIDIIVFALMAMRYKYVSPLGTHSSSPLDYEEESNYNNKIDKFPIKETNELIYPIEPSSKEETRL